MFPTDAVGPLTGHIMWTKPLQSGGVVGGNNYDIKGNTYFEGSAYIQRYMNPIIVNGKIYYSRTTIIRKLAAATQKHALTYVLANKSGA